MKNMGRKRRRKPLLERIALTGIADKGRSVGRAADGRVVFVEGAVPGDVVDVQVTKKRRDYYVGFATHWHEQSSERVAPFCAHFGLCGGCKWQHLDYAAQLRYKQEVVRQAMVRIAKVEPRELLPIVGAARTRYYRNKLEYSFSRRRWLTRAEIDSGVSNEVPVAGFHAPGSFDKVIDIAHCHLQPEPSNALRHAVKEIALQLGMSFYDMKEHRGFLRNMVVRTTSLGQVMVILAFGEADRGLIDALLEELVRRFPELTSLYYCINRKQNDFLLDLDMVCYHGQEVVEEQLGHVRFAIGPKSFFQTNTEQAKRLYDVVASFAGLRGQEVVYDLYTGLGSIALYVAHRARKVVGIEEVEAAVEDARLNALRNDIDNCVFYAGDVRDCLSSQLVQQHGPPDVVITDPPRAGMHKGVVEMLCELRARRIVYVSCNPATQARDIQLLSSVYELTRLQPVDMFPHTHHIESVAQLDLRD